MDWLNRTEMLIGKENINKLKNSTIIIFGIGGVGSYVIEALARTGIGNLIIIDKDIVDVTNINRQLIANTSTIGLNKIDVAKKHLLNINPNLNIITHKVFVNKDNIDQLISSNASYVIDCIDTISSKLDIIEYCYNNNIKIISCMGTGNKLNPLKFEIDDINKTSVCPLAKIIRKELKNRNIPHLKVLYSKETPIKTNLHTPASISFVPSVAGLILASEVINEIIS